jgi:hypothetical protein
MIVPTEEFWDAVAASSLATAVRQSIWIYPFLQTVHVIGLALLFGAITTFDLRVLGLNKELAVSQLWRHVKPCVWCGFLMTVASGVPLFIGGAADFADNPAMQLKLLFIVLACLNAAVFEFRLRPSASQWDRGVAAPHLAHLSAALSLTFWLAVMIAGRMIAYIR